MKFLRFLLFPFAVLYGIAVFLRNKFYDWHFIPSSRFNLPTIVVGNISMGGTGKSPHIEYLIRLLKNDFKVATLSRGYGRQTNGFILADKNSSAKEIGDEPKQFKNKFDEIAVSVDADRVNGINTLMKLQTDLQVILLDDAFQHRAVTAGLTILLTDYSKMYCDDYILPIGNLREMRSGAKRADIIIVTKCPEYFSQKERIKLTQKLHAEKFQMVYFTYIKYGEITKLFSDKEKSKSNYFDKEFDVVLLTGIANTKPMEDYLKGNTKSIVFAKYADHHPFTENDLNDVIKKFNTIASDKKIILTTEKDAMRLMTSEFEVLLKNLPIFYLPIEIKFHDNDQTLFNQQIINYVRQN